MLSFAKVTYPLIDFKLLIYPIIKKYFIELYLLSIKTIEIFNSSKLMIINYVGYNIKAIDYIYISIISYQIYQN